MSIIEELKGFASLTSGRQRDYFDQMLRDAHVVKVFRMSEVLTKEQIDIIRSLGVEVKQCYKNATLITQAIPEIEYIEGKTSIFKDFSPSIDHAWNKLGDKYFDATAEIIHKGLFGEYVSLIEVSSEEVMNIAIENEFYGEVYNTKFKKSIKH